ncbi:spore coat protein CotH [Nonomuraea sp. KC401]|uniref:CotH kinase family protein n=1 Tax=unclassified Nonomuraea TaxID=2593643 RepID=UPI0010FE8930|nr:CotH kinase family protein [Nonomuraea sp. KC401]NBE97915.1 spore coat protein CotH [Nonomuraea sp. K271]TLF61990.1 spore coat protein CotH [Nonomuraea sp. KC401]
MARLRHRIPVRLRHHWRLVAACVAFLAACYGVLGSGTVRPYVTSVRTASAGVAVRDLAGSKELFDAAALHDVALTFRDESYQDMLAEYFKDGDKKYVEADLTIDGTMIPSVGIRLKGNSTLHGLTWKGQTRPRATSGRGNPPEGFRPPGGEPPEGVKPPQDGRRRGGRDAALKAEEPENLPWLISFDEFVEGRRYQGHSQLAVRPAMGSAAVLNEAVAIALVDAAGEPSQRSAYTSFSVNGRRSAPRLLVEYLDEGYAERLGDGVLYKSLASGSFTYQGEDQTAYADDFKQVNQVGRRDLQPVIDLVRWVEQASDEEFASGLAERLDVVSFARYAALQNILLNHDDMAGPGNNYYLWYDLGTERFRVISWDMNLALRGDATTGPHDVVGMRRPGDRAARPGAGERPEQQGRPPDTRGAGGPRGGHALKERFLKDAGFQELYEREHAALTRDLLAGGTATALLDQALKAYGLNAGADRAKAAEEAAGLRATLETRAESLAG